MKECKETRLQKGAIMCRIAELAAPSASKNCALFYFQPTEPDNLKEFVAKKKDILEGLKND